MASVTLEKVSKLYRGGVVGAKDVSLEIRDGEFISLVGPSGWHAVVSAPAASMNARRPYAVPRV